MKKVAIYARVSTTDKGQDLDTQLIPLQEYVRSRGWEIFRIFADKVSGGTEKRQELSELMEGAYKRLFDTVLVYRFDRFARSTKHLIASLEEFGSLGIDFISYNEKIDTSTPIGKAMFTIISAFAELERSIISERVKDGLYKARAKGKKLGRPTVSKRKKQDEIIKLTKQGFSISQISKELGVSEKTVERVRKNISQQ